MINPPLQNDAGFTLLEMIVAFVILSISMAIASQTLAIAVRSYRTATERNEMLELVQTLRAEEIPKLTSASARQKEGKMGLLRWRIRMVSPRERDATSSSNSFAIISVGPKAGAFRQTFLVTSLVQGQQP
ncbi:MULTISPECIES: type II secretion system protein [unclassified Rhizobium]|uniref:type II secretion system protein n=1 Tax=unclassified Rhizobium TaxID=2613769 RepID=UPI001C82CBC8|nr:MULTISPECIES: prepilin-type N-terminal cleavage/methylation domain-containing protein [unclassified Rhizobium]MBX5230573.1 prepilin-type N-terminal cleavage/methylation domain-containing protein [Rhizobium sp. NLR9b]MBX5242727.1 prepilin-type N-terminal cleavage/methylation domain-containing protein [Rhizobium sp. NLR22b]MBX5291241.1 prepilin-type N-terminal cleavage/methylation domain-containing protein [Rhizobium sp. NLR10b]